MVEVNSAYNHGTYGRIWLASSRLMSNVNVFATQLCGRTGGQIRAGQPNTNTPDCIDRYRSNVIYKISLDSYQTEATHRQNGHGQF